MKSDPIIIPRLCKHGFARAAGCHLGCTRYDGVPDHRCAVPRDDDNCSCTEEQLAAALAAKETKR